MVGVGATVEGYFINLSNVLERLLLFTGGLMLKYSNALPILRENIVLFHLIRVWDTVRG
jgi:hypothetical protein